MCTSNHLTVLNSWKTRNSLEKSGFLRPLKCNKPFILNKQYYTVNKHFIVYFSRSRQYFTRHDYDMRDGELAVCDITLRPISYKRTKEDLLMCNDSIMNIKYDDKYKIWDNFSMLHKTRCTVILSIEL